MKKVGAILMVLCLFVVIMVGCTKESKENEKGGEESKVESTESKTSTNKKIKIGFAQKTLENEYQKALAEGLVEAGEAKGWEVTVLNAKNSIENEQKNMETFVSLKYDMIFINVVDTEAATASINAASEAGIPVIGIDSHVAEDAKVVTNIASPSYGNGRLVGLYAAKQYDVDELISTGLLSGNKGNPGGLDRRLGLFTGVIEGRIGCTETEARKFAEEFEQQLVKQGKALNQDANFEVVAQGWGGWSIEGGLPEMEDIMVANPDINCVMGENDSMLIGAMGAIEAADKLDQIQIFAAADAMKGALEAIMDGSSYKATGLNDPVLVAAKGIDVAAEVLIDGTDPKSYEKIVYTDAACITIENAEEYYDADATF
ncbi:substrate-binding domain-containing protein [Vallitalea maricola]|uniref:Substrate-binding domain-containing protein n=1 Tax=Vallitalea maricola TaxID=3074433 RepID=A0ACB5UFT2_9FIRM|nr:substrate-binding domain-containing protein [Vallitalea sp. AN17-2]